MNNPQLYNSAHELQQKDSARVLSEHMKQINWKPGARIMDIGCGPGFVTSKVLLPSLPQDFETLLGLDISHNMIQYANDTYIHPKLKFMQLDIGTENISNDLWSPGFDKIFSFFCLQYVPDQRRAFSNISRLLRPDGDVLVIIVSTCAIFDVYTVQSTKSKWRPYLKDFEKYISPYHKSSDAKEDLKKVLIGTDLYLLKFELKKTLYHYESFKIFQDSIIAINPFIDNMPDDLCDEYIKDTIAEAESLEKGAKNNNGKYGFSYEIMVAHLRKS